MHLSIYRTKPTFFTVIKFHPIHTSGVPFLSKQILWYCQEGITFISTRISAIPWDPILSLSSSHPNSTYLSVLQGQLTSHFITVVILEHFKPHQSVPFLKSHSPQVHTTNFSMLNCSSLYYLYLFHLVNFMKTRDFFSYKTGVDYHDIYFIGLLRQLNT